MLKPILSPINPSSPAGDITNLQDALLFLFEQGQFVSRTPPDQPSAEELAALVAKLRRERVQESYGEATRQLVFFFQLQSGLGDNSRGLVDDRTLTRLNELLKQLGAFEQEPASRSYIVTGEVRREDDLPLLGMRVRAAHETGERSIRLGEDVTDAEGHYTIRYELLPGLDAVNLRVTAIGEDGRLLQSSEVIRNAKPLEILDLKIPIDARQATPHRLEGQVVLDHGLPAENLKLRLYRRDFGGQATLLAETSTLAGGQYAFSYNSGDQAASLEVRAVKSTNEEIALSKPLNDTNRETRTVVNLVAPGDLQPLAAEYRRLSADLTPHIGEMSKLAEARENAERQDLTVLNRATGWDARLIALAAITERLSADPEVKLPQEGLYGLLRAGLPSDKLMLAQVEPEVAEQALKKARNAGIVELSDEQIGEFKSAFNTFSNNVRLHVPAPGTRSTYGALLKTSGLSQQMQDKFVPVYLNHRGDAAQLWDKARKAGLKEAQIRRLQRQGKLAFLTGNSAGMTERLMKKRINGTQISDPAQLVDLDFHRTETWAAEVLTQAKIPAGRRNKLTEADKKKLDELIPTAYAAPTMEERLAAYAEDMARKVRLSYPTQVLGRMLETDDKFKPLADAASAGLLKSSARNGFRLGETPVEAYFKNRMTEEEFKAAQPQLQQVKTLQRIYQITPSNEAMPVLRNLGMESAYDVTAYSEAEFVAFYEEKYQKIYGRPAPAGEAQLISRKARQVSSVTYNLFAIAKKMNSEPQVAGLSAPVEVRESVRNELIKQFPTMESLFGSMDFCECEHCRSVLSPAAYYVDLLQFVDPEPGVWGNFLDKWLKEHGGHAYTGSYELDGQQLTGKYKKPYAALIERRPDLPHIALTCENTHTALPYIDVVNEILEYYVAHGKLEEKAAHDTGGATTAELLAEPQNVIREAYDKLREARYPLNLPFDLWIETVRQFCNYFETPLARVLEVFRPGDALADREREFIETLGLAPAEAAIFAGQNPLPRNTWHELYGFPSDIPFQNPTNVGNATLAVANSEARKLRKGLAVSYFDVSASVLSADSLNIQTIGTPDSGGNGQTLITLDGVWPSSPQDDDLLVCIEPEALRSAKALSRSLGVTYKEIAEIVQTGFVNPKLAELALLYKLGVGIRDARFYLDHKKLLGEDPSTLSSENQQRQLEVKAFAQELAKLAETFQVTTAGLEAELQGIPFDNILVLADPDTGCNFDLTTLQYADGTKAKPIDFLRINLFVRLWRKLDWSIEETDRALCTFIPQSALVDATKLPKWLATALIYLAHLKTLDERLKAGKQSRIKLLALWSDIATTGKKPLYAQLFLTRSVLKSDPIFDHPLGKYLQYFDTTDNVYKPFRWDPAQPENATTGNVPLKPHLLALQGALGLTAGEIRRIIEDANKSIDAAELSLPNVSQLYRYGLLAKALKLTVQELIALKQISGLDPFKPLHSDPLTDIKQDHLFVHTLRFVEVAEEVRDSGLKIEDLDYLLRHRFDETGKYRTNREGTLALLKTLAEGVRAIRAEHAAPDDPGAMSEETLRQKLGLVLPTEVVATFMAVMNRTAEFTATRSVASADQLHPADFAGEPSIFILPYNSIKNEQTLVCRGVLFEAQKTALKAGFSASLPAGQKATFETLLDEVQAKAQQQVHAFFDKHLLKPAPGVQPASGFLDAADFDLLFQPMPSGLTETQQQERVRQQRTRLAQAFFPYLQQRLIRQFVVQTMTAHTAADSVLVESLITDERLLAVDSKPLLSAFSEIGERGITATYWFSADQSGVAFTTQLRAGDTSIPAGKVSSPFRFAGAAVAELDGYFEAPEDGDYEFTIVLAKKDDEVELYRGDQLNPPIKKVATRDGEELTTPLITLEKGKRYPVGLVVKGLGARHVGLMVKSNTLPKATYNSCRLDGYLEVPTPGAYRFHIELDKQDAEAELRFEHLPDPVFLKGKATAANAGKLDEFLELKPGLLYRFSLDLKKLNGGGARLLVQGETLPKYGISQLTLYPLSTMAAAERATLLLSKALQLVQSLGLSEREIRYLLTHAGDFDGLSLSELPTQVVGDTPAEKAAATNRFTRFLRLAAYARLKRDLAAGTDDLIDVFEANGTGDLDKVYSLIAKLTRRDQTTIGDVAEALFAAPSFKSEKTLVRLWEALQVVERFGVPVASLKDWTRIVGTAATPVQRFEITRDLKEAIKARFETEAWQRVAQPIFDKLRQRQRDALVSHVMHQHGFARMEQLYEYFLIDPGMEPVVQTSRIRLAIASVQLFVQRCLLNLEKDVHPSAIINAKHWEWMKRYRVWEANRKIFLFPENWLEPEFRDDKTHLFSELEGALLQGDVSNDLVEDAFLNYLKKLDELARLDIAAMHIEDNDDPARRILHVFGRTYSQPHKYFYRRYAHQMWTPWEPVSAEIEGDHLAPVVWRDRLYLFWVTFMEKADQNTEKADQEAKPAQKTEEKGNEKTITNMTIPEVMKSALKLVANKKVEVQLHWSEYLQGEWSTRESSGFSAVISGTVPFTFAPSSVFIHVSKEYEAGEERGVYIHLGGAINQAFYVAGRNSAPEKDAYSAKPTNPFSANTEHANRYAGESALTVTFNQRVRNGHIANQIPFWRLYNENIQDHFYTTDAAERDRAIRDYGYKDDGVACYVLPGGDRTGIPLFRLWNDKAGDHFYTTKIADRDRAIRDYGYKDEGVACNVLPVGDSSGTPLYRLWNANVGDHFYTTDATERDRAIKEYGFTREDSDCAVILREEQSKTLDILGRQGAYTLLPCDNSLFALGISDEAHEKTPNSTGVKIVIESGMGEIASLVKPVFYQDNAHTLFIEPNVTERTIEEWQEWVTRTPQPEPEWREQNWWNEIKVIPELPEKFLIPDIRGPIGNGRDWLVNPATVLQFDNVLIGRNGQPGLHILNGKVAETIGRMPVNINPGSGFASNGMVVLADIGTFENNGLIQAPSGLNVVGGAGFNSALAKNFDELTRSGFGAGMPETGINGR